MTAQMMRLEVRDELLAIRREPATLFFSVLMPVLFFTMFLGLFGPEGVTDAGIIAPYGTFAVLAVVMLSPGIGLADARGRGWLRVKRVSEIPLGITLLAKVTAAIPYAMAVLLALTVVAVLVGDMTVDVGMLLRVFVVLVLGALPFALFSLAVGALAGTTASAAILNAILMPMVIVSGLWFPHEIMPEWVVSIGEFLPTYHLAQLAMVQVEGGPWLGHLAVLALTAVVGAIVAALAYRSAQAVSQESAVRERPGHRSAFPEWLYLGFLVFLFLGPIFNPNSTTVDWVVAAVTAVVSAVIFIIAIRNRGFRTPAAVVLLAVGVTSTWLGTAAMGVIPIYSAALVAGFVTRRVLVWRLVGITLLTVAAMAVSPIPPPFVFLAFGPALPLIWLIGFSVEADIGLSRETISLRAENARVQHLATVTERERIARDLHDLAGQALTAIALRSELVQQLAATDPGRAIEEAAAIGATARETLASVRKTVAGWQQVVLTDELDKATTALKTAGVEPSIEGEWRQDLAPSVETVLALALREAVTNVVRHSGARSCRIGLSARPGEVSLLVSDDGRGSREPEGSGLRGMRERVMAAGGRLEFTTGQGTSLLVTMPVGAP